MYPSQHFPFGVAFVCQAGNFWTLLHIYIYIVCQNCELLNITSDGIYSYKWDLRGRGIFLLFSYKINFHDIWCVHFNRIPFYKKGSVAL